LACVDDKHYMDWAIIIEGYISVFRAYGGLK
jgi:hypothetical protein